MKTLFIDESEDHNLAVIDPQYPVFVLGGVVLDSAYADGELTERVDALKTRLFGTADTVLPTADICRNRKGFERLAEPGFRHTFYEEINSLMESLEYTVLACAIRKHDYVNTFGANSRDLYSLCMETLVEILCTSLDDVDSGGEIIAESRGSLLDGELRRAWQRLEVRGTRHLLGCQIRRRLRALQLRSKSENIAGLQLADLVVAPIGRYLLGKTTHEDYLTVERKLLRNPGENTAGEGLVILPKGIGQDPLRSS